MFVDELGRALSPQQQRERIEPGDDPLQLTPFIKKMVTGSLARRTLLRK